MFEIVGREKQEFNQWEQDVILTNPCMKAGDEVVFRNSSGATYVMIAGASGVEVPNKILQMSCNILVDLEQGLEQHTDCQTVFKVNPGAKPDGYVCDDNSTHEAPGEKAVWDAVESIVAQIDESDLPTVYYGSGIPQTKDETIMTIRFVSKAVDVNAFCETKAQGNSSMTFPKKNQTTKFYADLLCENKLKLAFRNWGKQNKFCLKANYNDLSHARNVVSARIWGDMVRTRPDFNSLPELMKTSPNFGAIDGFPVRVFANGEYQGRYSFNIPKDKWMANMDDENPNHCILCGENYGSGCFRAAAVIDGSDWTDEIHDTVPDNIKTRWNEIISFVQNSTDEDFKANLHNYLNVPSLIDYHIFGLACCHMDGFGKNQLFLTYDGQVFYASVYDMDATWGNHFMGTTLVSSDYARTSYEDYVSTGSSGEGHLLYIRLEQLFADEIKERWDAVKTTALSLSNIQNHFEKWASICPPWLVAEDYAETTGGGAFTEMPGQDFNNIQQIRSFSKARHEWTEAYINGEPEVNLWDIGNRNFVLVGGAESSHPSTATPDSVPNNTLQENEFCISATRNGYIFAYSAEEQTHEISNNNITFKVKNSGVGLLMPVAVEAGETYKLEYTTSDSYGQMALLWYDADMKYVGASRHILTDGLTYSNTFVAPNYPYFAIHAAANSETTVTLPETITFADVSLVKVS